VVGPPHRLNLIALEEAWQFRLVLRHDARQRHREVVAQGQVSLAARFVLASLQDLEDEAIAFFAVLAEERLDVLVGGRFERLEAVALVHLANDPHDVLALADIVGQEVARAARRLGRDCAHW